jgi:hypothetical protein
MEDMGLYLRLHISSQWRPNEFTGVNKRSSMIENAEKSVPRKQRRGRMDLATLVSTLIFPPLAGIIASQLFHK